LIDEHLSDTRQGENKKFPLHDLVRQSVDSRRQSFETGMLAGYQNLIELIAVNRELIAQAETSDDSDRVVLDMGSTESPLHERHPVPAAETAELEAAGEARAVRLAVAGRGASEPAAAWRDAGEVGGAA